MSSSKIKQVLGSRRFYWFVLGFFVFEALWVVFSAVYPMAFDEDFHLGVIRIYSHQLSPFLAGQPDVGGKFGALAVDPSYLYHYLMSFPYRIVSVFTDNQAAQVIVLRLLNVGMAAAGLVLFRRVLLRAGTSPALTNTALLLFALVPTVPLLAGQINYDNLMFLALAGTCWLVLDITEDLRARQLNLRTYALLAALLLLASLVKYAFLPIALATFLYVVFMTGRTFRGKHFRRTIAKSYAVLSRRTVIILAVLLVAGAGLFAQRYGADLVRYHSPLPDCGKVLSEGACMQFGPWARNHNSAARKPADFVPNPFAYTWGWLQGLHYRLFFMITGPPRYTNYPPALLPSAAAVIIPIFGLVALFFHWRQVFAGRPFLAFLLLVALLYVAALWADNYLQYVKTARYVAINGRYLIPLLLLMAVAFGRGLSVALRSTRIKTVVAAVTILLFAQGGGVYSFILRSDPSWYWPNQAVTDVNAAAQQALSKVTFIGPKNY